MFYKNTLLKTHSDCPCLEYNTYLKKTNDDTSNVLVLLKVPHINTRTGKDKTSMQRLNMDGRS
jgi:hypothetical protein